MRKLICIVMLAVAPLLTAVADDRGDGHHDDGVVCTAKGAWYGGEVGADKVYRITYLVNYIPESTEQGSFVIDFPGFPVSMFDPAEKASMARGFWTRVNPTEANWVALVVLTKLDGTPVYVLKLRGPVKMTKHCTEFTVGTWVDVFLPDMDPFSAEPLQTIPMGNTIMHPMLNPGHPRR